MFSIIFAFLCPTCTNKPFEVQNQIRAENQEKSYFTIYDFSEPDKVVLVKEAKQRNLEIVSAMGAGNRTGIPSFKIAFLSLLGKKLSTVYFI